MELAELRASGLLELFAIGAASEAERKEVEKGLIDYPELKDDLFNIGLTLEKLAKINAIEPEEHLKSLILSKVDKESTVVRSIQESSTKSNTAVFWKIAASVLLLLSAYSIFQILNKQSTIDDMIVMNEKDKKERSQQIEQYEQELEKFKALHNENTVISELQSTEKFRTSSIVLYSNKESKRNYLELKRIPSIGSDKSFQLWSLKPNQDPIPLTVFQDDLKIVEVDFEEGTPTYAITIEDFGGKDIPDLNQLIGTITLEG